MCSKHQNKTAGFWRIVDLNKKILLASEASSHSSRSDMVRCQTWPDLKEPREVEPGTTAVVSLKCSRLGGLA